MSQFGIWVRAMRKTRRWTQEELAARSGVSQSFISALETGARRYPGIETMRAIGLAFGMPVEEVLRKVGYAKLEKRHPAVPEVGRLVGLAEDREGGESPEIRNGR